MRGGLPAPTESRTVLVVEDNPDHALLVRLAAERAEPGLDVRVANGGHAALAYLEGSGRYADRSKHPFPGLVILDLLMPNMDGFTLMEWIRRRGWRDMLPLVVLTSSINPVDERRAARLGARSFHTKPANLDDLGREVRQIVRRWLD